MTVCPCDTRIYNFHPNFRWTKIRHCCLITEILDKNDWKLIENITFGENASINFSAYYSVFFIKHDSHLPPRCCSGREFALHAGDRVWSPVALKQVVRATLPKALQHVWVARVLREYYYKWLDLVTVGVGRCYMPEMWSIRFKNLNNQSFS